LAEGNTEMTEQQRIADEYRRRASEESYRYRYSMLDPASLHAMQSRERAVMALLRRQGISDLPSQRLLDVGCGSGGELLRWISYGCQPDNCAGIDLMPDRVAQARGRLPAAVRIDQGDASRLPHESSTFDFVTQFTVISSILDAGMRSQVAAEMLRVLKPCGLIVWYDFWINPANRQTRGVRLREIKSLFPGCTFDSRRVTLAPPLARRIVPHSWLLGSLLEQLPLRTHWLVGIRKQ
jgi:ubiquinone/menaquinone biosynthesis C-methylase UbiE